MAKIAEYNAPVEKLRPSDAGYSASETAARQIRVSYNEAGTADREVGTLANDLVRTIAQEQREAGASRVRGLEGGGGRVGVTKNYFGSGRDTASGFNRLTGIAAGLAGNSETDVYPDSAFAQYASKADAMYSNTAIGQPGYKGPNPTMSYDQQLKEQEADSNPNNPYYQPKAVTPAVAQQMAREQYALQHGGTADQGIEGAPGEDALIPIPVLGPDGQPTGASQNVAPGSPEAQRWIASQQVSLKNLLAAPGGSSAPPTDQGGGTTPPPAPPTDQGGFGGLNGG